MRADMTDVPQPALLPLPGGGAALFVAALARSQTVPICMIMIIITTACTCTRAPNSNMHVKTIYFDRATI